jgi:hypothetical protein
MGPEIQQQQEDEGPCKSLGEDTWTAFNQGNDTKKFKPVSLNDT